MSKFHNDPEESRDWNVAEEAGDTRDPMRADLKAYLDGELSALRRWQVRCHLARCSACREEVTWLTRLGNDIKQVEQAVPRPELRARILANLPDVPPGRLAGDEGPLNLLPRPVRRAPRLAFGGALAALALVSAFALARTGLPFFSRPAAPPRLAADLPASPRPDGSFRPAPMVSTGQEGSVGAQQAASLPSPLSHAAGKGSGVRANQGEVPNASSEPSDGTYDRAEKLARQRWAAMQAEDRRLRALMAQMQAEQHAAQKSRTPKPEAPLRLALAVQNVEGTRAHLLAILNTMEGSLTEKPSKSGPISDPPAIAPSVPHPPGSVQAIAPVNGSVGQKKDAPPAQIASAPTLIVRVPADRARALLDNLQQMGALREIAPDADAAHTPFKVRSTVKNAQRRPGEAAVSRPGKAAPTATLAVSEHLRRIEESLRRRGDGPPDAMQPPSRTRPFVTILLRLQAQQTTANPAKADRQ
jgi:hypothetical protein